MQLCSETNHCGYLGRLLRLETPDQVALLGHTGVGTRAGVCWGSGGRSHARFVVQARLLLKLGLDQQPEPSVSGLASLCAPGQLKRLQTHLQGEQLLNCPVHLIFGGGVGLQLAHRLALGSHAGEQVTG